MSYTDSTRNGHIHGRHLPACKELQRVFPQRMTIQITRNPEGLRHPTRPGTQGISTASSLSNLIHPCDGVQGPNENRCRKPDCIRYHIEAPVDPIAPVHVGTTRWPKH